MIIEIEDCSEQDIAELLSYLSNNYYVYSGNKDETKITRHILCKRTGEDITGNNP